MFEPIGFLHIQKTAGTSFTNYVKDLFGDDVHHYYDQNNIYSPSTQAHQNEVRFYFGHFTFHEMFIFHEKPRVITFLRDPVERLFSQYYHHRNYFRSLESASRPMTDAERAITNELFVQTDSFADFCRNKKSKYTPFHDYDNAMVRAISGIGRKALFGEIDDYILSIAKRNLDKMWFFGLAEKMEDSLMMFFEKVGILEDFKKVYVPNSHFEKKSNRPEIETAENLEIAKSMTKYDQMLYNYALEKFTNQ